jgi:hypothetical protein
MKYTPKTKIVLTFSALSMLLCNFAIAIEIIAGIAYERKLLYYHVFELTTALAYSLLLFLYLTFSFIVQVPL